MRGELTLLSSDFRSLGLYFEPLGVFFLRESVLGLSKSILGHKESILSQWESILGFGNTFGARYVDVRHLGVNFGLWESISALRNRFYSHGGWLLASRSIFFLPRGVDFRSLGADFWPLRVNFVPLDLKFGICNLQDSILGPYKSILAIEYRVWAWESFYTSGTKFWCLEVHFFQCKSILGLW